MINTFPELVVSLGFPQERGTAGWYAFRVAATVPGIAGSGGLDHPTIADNLHVAAAHLVAAEADNTGQDRRALAQDVLATARLSAPSLALSALPSAGTLAAEISSLFALLFAKDGSGILLTARELLRLSLVLPSAGYNEEDYDAPF